MRSLAGYTVGKKKHQVVKSENWLFNIKSSDFQGLLVVTMWRFGAISWTRLCIKTNLEVLVFVSVDVAHVSLQLVRVEETLRAVREFASAESKVKMRSRLRGATVQM